MLLSRSKVVNFDKLNRDLRFLIGCFREILVDLGAKTWLRPSLFRHVWFANIKNPHKIQTFFMPSSHFLDIINPYYHLAKLTRSNRTRR